MARRGRPRIKIDKEEFEKLCAMQCTLIEIAGWFNCSDDTIENWCKETYGEIFSEVYKKKSAKGKISVRRDQFRAAESGNVTMLIWLGKQYLGQKEQSVLEVSENIDDTVKEMNEYFAKKKTGSGASVE